MQGGHQFLSAFLSSLACVHMMMTRYPANGKHFLEQICCCRRAMQRRKHFAACFLQATDVQGQRCTKSSACVRGHGRPESTRRQGWPRNACGALTSRSAVTRLVGGLDIVQTSTYLSPNAY